MNYKSCKVINDNFTLEASFSPMLKAADGDKAVPVTSGLEKGYIYAALFFYDEVQKEIEKLRTMIKKIYGDMMLDVNIKDPALLQAELSKRVRGAVGDDSLDALIKEVLGAEHRHIALVPDKAEESKYELVIESIFTETVANFYQTAFVQAVEERAHRTVTLAPEYVASMTERQKKLIAPALRMVAFLNNFKPEGLTVDASWKVRFMVEPLSAPFDKTEETIKANLKELMAKNLAQ
jgi:hypothetical protein